MISASDPVTIEVGGAALDCCIVPWDSAIFDFAVAQITRVDLGEPGTTTSGVFEAFDSWCADHRVRLAACRLDHRLLRESMELEANGFRFVEMVYEPRLDALDGVEPPARRIDVTDATVEDLPAIQAVAATAFTTGRFRLDPRIPPGLSDQRYANWVRSAFETPPQHVLKAESEGALVGFFIVERRPDTSVYWHLTAVAPAWQGKGFGLGLWQTMLRRHAEEGAALVATTISGHNLAALNLYARLGFTFPSARMTLHRWRDGST